MTVFVIGSAAFLPGLVLVSIGIWRSTVPPRWLGLVNVAGCWPLVPPSRSADRRGSASPWIAAAMLLRRARFPQPAT